ncbi:MAG TPA: copper amine oxidase N-terminal domain-containing protein [Epulopiscium sp.]|nr:copper amine oxidase N-terminal domain-containing protein [Candidatus Epulonipiscium sp.]
MKMRKKLAALLAAAMIASVMPMSVFADSTNRVDKVVTVEKDKNIGGTYAPELKVTMKDKLTPGLSFYLELTGAEWAPMSTDEVTIVTTATTAGGISFTPPTETWVNSNNALVGKLGAAFVGQTITDSPEDVRLRNAAIAEATKVAEKKGKEANVDATYTEKASYNRPVKAVTFTLPAKVGTSATFEAYRENDKTMAIKLVTGTFGAEDEFKFPLLAKVTGSEAIVNVRKHDTEVSNSEHVFAVSDAAKAKVVVGSVPNFYRTTSIADITIEELYANAVNEVKDGERWFTLELRDTDFTFAVPGKDAKLVGERAYREIEFKLDTNYPGIGSTDTPIWELSNDKTRLGIRIPKVTGVQRERGNFVLKGIEVIAARDARNGEVKAVIDSKELFGKETITIANRGDYKTKLDVPKDWKYEVVAGKEKEVKFILSEELANSLVGRRPVTFTFDQGVKIKTDVSASSKDWTKDKADYILWGGSESELNKLIDAVDKAVDPTTLAKAQAALYKHVYRYDNVVTGRPGETEISVNKDIISVKGDDVTDKGDWSTELNRVHIAKDRQSFTVDFFEVIQDKAGKYTFTTTLLVPASVTGDIKVAVAGSGVTEEEIVILKAEAPVTVDTAGMDVKVGLKEIETTGKITIKETAKERIAQGKDIVLDIADQDYGLKIKSFKATVVAGDLVLADRKVTDVGGLEVKRVSTEPSTIEITDIVMSTDRTVPEGKYDFLIGGSAISSITGRREFAKNDHFEIDPVVVVKDFINITTKNTEDISGNANTAEVKFTIGTGKYLVNGEEKTMDAPAYNKNGNTMVPVRYVAKALGVTEDKITWNGATQTATIIADKVVQVKIGSKDMNINGVSVPMDVSAELTDTRTYVPMGAIARALGVTVEWDNTNKTATFNPAK